MKKTLFKVIVYIFCVFSIVELCAEEGIDDLEKKNFFKIERLEAEIILLKDQYKLLTEQERLNIEKKSESEVSPDLKQVVIELAAGIYSTLNTKINSLNKDILLLKDKYKLLSEDNCPVSFILLFLNQTSEIPSSRLASFSSPRSVCGRYSICKYWKHKSPF